MPIVAGVGVAVGVFGGLMIIFGTGDSDAASPGNKPVVAMAADAGAGGATTDPGGERQGTMAQDGGSGAKGDNKVAQIIDAAPPEPEPRTVVLTFDADPSDARIMVDGEDVEGDSFTIELEEGEEKQVEVEARSRGYRRWSETVTLRPDVDEETVSIEMDRRRRPSKKKRPGRGGRRKKPRGPGGLIDL